MGIPEFYHIKVPEGDYVFTNSWWDIVDGEGHGSIALTEVYNHHYLIGATNSGLNPLTLCEDSLFWGGGAEYRNMDYRVPKGYGIMRINATGVCGANLHFIRQDDLKLDWQGLNNPNGSKYAALKNCAECGYAPGRALECGDWADGSFLCCFTDSRCPVNNPRDRTTKTYRMKYTIEWTRNFTGQKNMRLHCFDLGGPMGVHKNQNIIDGISEWNVASHLNDEALNQHCNASLCNITSSIVVGQQHGLEGGMCAGEMLWSYTHQHAGAIKSTMFINGKKHCENVPTIGTDLNNTPGNEAGFLVSMSECVNDHLYGNRVRLNKGDIVTVEALYDVDPASTTFAPMPGGKHGGIMALFFSVIHCDPGTWNERYVCRNRQCIGVGKGKHLDASEPQWNTIEDCSKECSSELPNFLQKPIVRYEDKDAVALPNPHVSSAAQGIDKLYINTRNCATEKFLTPVQPVGSPSFRLFGKHKIEATFVAPADVDGGQIIFKTDAGIAGLTLVDMTTDACASKQTHTLFGLLTFGWNAATCPITAGTNVTISANIEISPLIPMVAAETTTTIVWTTSKGETLLC